MMFAGIKKTYVPRAKYILYNTQKSISTFLGMHSRSRPIPGPRTFAYLTLKFLHTLVEYFSLRKKEKKISSQYVILIWKSHNISERCYFCRRKHIEVGLNFSLAAG